MCYIKILIKGCEIIENSRISPIVLMSGPSGSGKTTIADLILRTYNVPDGTVFIDGNDVNDEP